MLSWMLVRLMSLPKRSAFHFTQAATCPQLESHQTAIQYIGDVISSSAGLRCRSQDLQLLVCCNGLCFAFSGSLAFCRVSARLRLQASSWLRLSCSAVSGRELISHDSACS